MSEIWKKIPNASKYEVSNTGEVRSWNTQRGGLASSPTLMKKKLNKKVGYYNVGITYDDGVQKTRYVHRLVAEAFLGYKKDSLVRHLNDNRLDNHVENLAWGTQKQNMSDAIINGKLPTGTDCSQSVLSERDILLIARMEKEGLTRAMIARIIGVNVSVVNALLRGKTYTSNYLGE
jgi:hypothetical protein